MGGGGASDSYLGSTSEARALDESVTGTGLLTVPNWGVYNVAHFFEGVVTRVDMGYGGGNFYPTDSYPGSAYGNHFLVSVSATVTIPLGTWTMWVASDDGRILNMPGITFDSVSGQNSLHDGGAGTSIIGYENPTGHMYSRGTFHVAVETTVNLYAMFWERTGGDSFELAIAPGQKTGSTDFEILKDGVLGWAVNSGQP